MWQVYHVSHHRKSYTHFREYRALVLLQGYEKDLFFSLRPMNSNYLKCNSIKLLHSIKLKFIKYIISHRRMNSIDFQDCKLVILKKRIRKKILIHYALQIQIMWKAFLNIKLFKTEQSWFMLYGYCYDRNKKWCG